MPQLGIKGNFRGQDSFLVYDDKQHEPSDQGEDPRDVAHNKVDEPMKDHNHFNKNKGNSTASRQNEKLYTGNGILNTKIKKAEKKKRKKSSKASSDPMDGELVIMTSKLIISKTVQEWMLKRAIVRGW
ncbi:unnamed protein product [Lupinus luteus]|uniref:Uncharacterized protein n=1 Tax=Lupinus luteus TaxID=3873 RepID=A0AAV1YHQ8_LUPLU